MIVTVTMQNLSAVKWLSTYLMNLSLQAQKCPLCNTLTAIEDLEVASSGPNMTPE
jgi:hypothetical protein